jgi:hypothetical protein
MDQKTKLYQDVSAFVDTQVTFGDSYYENRAKAFNTIVAHQSPGVQWLFRRYEELKHTTGPDDYVKVADIFESATKISIEDKTNFLLYLLLSQVHRGGLPPLFI